MYSFSTTRPKAPQWYCDAEAPFWNGPAELTAAYVTRLFEEPLPALEGFREAELNIGLNYLISPGFGEHMRCLDDPAMPLPARAMCTVLRVSLSQAAAPALLASPVAP